MHLTQKKLQVYNSSIQAALTDKPHPEFRSSNWGGRRGELEMFAVESDHLLFSP